jgi:hypothetical protein
MKESMGDSSAAGLRRYQFYFTRFENHQKSIKFAERIRVDAEKKMNKMQDMEGTSLNQVAFLLDAVNTVIDCRRLLQWSYPWAFLLEDGSSLKTHFKMHQDMLEELTEELSGMTEQPLAKLMATKQRTAIINHTRVSHLPLDHFINPNWRNSLLVCIAYHSFINGSSSAASYSFILSSAAAVSLISSSSSSYLTNLDYLSLLIPISLTHIIVLYHYLAAASNAACDKDAMCRSDAIICYLCFNHVSLFGNAFVSVCYLRLFVKLPIGQLTLKALILCTIVSVSLHH